MDPHGPTKQHPFDDFDHVMSMHPNREVDSSDPTADTAAPGPTTVVTTPSAILVSSPPPLSSESSSSTISTSGTISTFASAQSTYSPATTSRHHHNFAQHAALSSQGPPVAPLQTSTTSLATSAAARFSQAFSPLLSSRRKSAAIDIPSTPDGHKFFLSLLSGSAHANSGSFHGSINEGGLAANHSQEHLSSHHQQQSSSSSNINHFENNFSKMTSFSSPRSTNRSRKTHPGGIAHPPEDSGYGPYATPPHTATAFHAGLPSHFGMGPSSSQNRDHHHDTGHKDGKGGMIGSGSSSPAEKALKKAKAFFDEKQKPKTRAASLWTFLDATSEYDHVKFFQEHADQVFTVTHDSFWHQVNKFKQKPDRNNGLQSKEVLGVQKTLLILRLIFLYLPERMKNGWCRRPIANMLAQVLCHKNHPRIRIFGFRLLLLWINDQTVEYPEAIYLFSNAVSLDLFISDGEEDLSVDHANNSQTRLPLLSTTSVGRKSAKQVSQYFEANINLNQELLQSDGPPICPNPSQPTFQDSIQLLQIFLGNIVRMAYVAAGSTPPPGELESINSHYPLEADGASSDGIAVGFGIDAGMAAARFMFDIIKKYYLVKVFPECARSLNLIRDEGKEFGYKRCPPTILRTIISFVIQYCLDSNEFNSPQTHTSPATPILKSIVYSSEANREIIHEIVRQGLSLPGGHPQYKDIIRGAVHIVGVWCLSSEEERPMFLRSPVNRSHQAPSSVSIASLGSQDSVVSQQGPSSQQGSSAVAGSTGSATPTIEPYPTANSFLQRYFQLLTNVFAENPLVLQDLGSNSSSEALGSLGNHVKLDTDALLHLYKDIIGLFRAILARGQIEMDTRSWEVLLGSLLEIQRRIVGLHEKLSSIMSPAAVDDLLSVVIETVLCAHSRCPNVSDAQWVALRKTVTEGLRHPQTVAQWAKCSVRLTHVLSHEVFQVDLDAPTSSRPTQTSASVTRHSRKMSDKFRHSRFHSSKQDNPMRHSIGGELLSSQGIAYPHSSHIHHQTYPLAGVNHIQDRSSSSRRANSVHYEQAKQGGGASGGGVNLMTVSGGGGGGGSMGSGSGGNGGGGGGGTGGTQTYLGFLPAREMGLGRIDIGEVDEDEMYDHVGTHISALTETLETNDEKLLSRASSLSFHGPDSLHLDPMVERLSSLYGLFAAPEFVNISMKGRFAENILSVWKNIVCSIGNPNDIQIPLVKTEVMLCLIDIWDLLNQTRAAQSINATLIPPLYDFAPWFFEAAKSSSDGGVGLPAIYGGLCRMMSRRYDQDFDPEYYQMFYASVIQGLQIEDSMIGHSILANSSRLFTLSLPGSHVLVIPYLNAIRQMLLKDGHLRDGVKHFIRKQAIAILCSVTMLFYDFAHQNHDQRFSHINKESTNEQDPTYMNGELLPQKLTFTRLVLDLTSAEANVKSLGKFWDTHSMLIQLCGMLVVNEWSSSLETCDIGLESELLSLVLDHLYWTEASIVQSAVEVITTLAGMYQDHEDNGWIILEMVLSHLLSALQEHLKLFQSDTRRGTTIASFYRCLVEWLMVIPARIFSETELSKWVFELIEVGLHCAPDSTGENERKRALQAARQQQQQQLPQLQHHQQRMNRKRGPSFKYTGKTIHQHHRVMNNTGPLVDAEVEQQVVKEAAEATLIHLVHFMNNIPSMYGSDRALVTMGMDSGNGNKDLNEQQQGANKRDSGIETQKVFALNDSILITLEEVPTSGPTMGPFHRTRVVIRDETGRYAWDSEIFYREMLHVEEVVGRPRSVQRVGSRLSGIGIGGSAPRRRKKELASQLIWREGVKIKNDEEHGNKPRIVSSVSTNSMHSSSQFGNTSSPSMEALLWDGSSSKSDGDMLDQLLHYIGDKHPDCLFDGKTPLNQLNNGMALSTESRDNASYPSSSDRNVNNGNRNGSGGNNGSTSKRSTIDFELDRHVQEENYYTRISDPQARAWYDKLVEWRSSLIQSDDDDDADEYHGSNTLMSLVVNANWNASTPSSPSAERQQYPQQQDEKGSRDSSSSGQAEGEDHTAPYNRAKHDSGRRVRHDNLQEIHEEAVGFNRDHSSQGPDRIPPRSSSLVEDFQYRNSEDSQREVLGTSLLKEDATNMAKAFQPVLPPEPERPLDSYQHSRLLLSHLGLLCFDRFQEHNFVLLNHSALLDRELKSLDKKSGRETFKIAILYVGQGQEGEQVILRNSKGSATYNQFVHDLGWEVELADHAGYLGGLERNGSNGQSTMYYCSSTLEVIFHEVVRMPTEPSDPRQVKKKRHVGNDHVHIVWSEHSRAYDRNTIGGDFGNVIIVLTPIPNLKIEEDGQLNIGRGQQQQAITASRNDRSSMVSVEVIRDTNLPVFGPLVDGMVVPMSQLGRLVRQTAIHAARLATAPPPLPPTPPSAGLFSSANGPGLGAVVGGMNGSGGGVGGAGGASGGGGGGHAGATGSTTSGVGVGGASGGSGQLGHRTSVYQPAPGSMINSAMQGHQYHLSNPAIHTGSVSAGGGVLAPTSGSFGAGHGNYEHTNPTTPAATSAPSLPATAAAAVPGTSALLTTSITSLVNVGSGPKAASVSSLHSNSGSANGGISTNSSNASGGGGTSLLPGGGNGGAVNGIASASVGGPGGSVSSVVNSSNATQTQSHHQQQQYVQHQQPYQQQVQSSSMAGQTSSASATVSSALSASMGVTHSAHPFKLRASAIELISRRHKIEKWTFQQFMEQVFGYSNTQQYPHHSRSL